MASARFPPNSNDFRLPSLKDLNFPYRPLQDEQQPWKHPQSHENPPFPQSSPVQPPTQPKRQRASLQHLPGSPYPPQFAPYPQQQPLPTSYPSAPPPPPPPSHEQIHPHPVYPPYPPQYNPPRPPHPHANPYSSPGPPPSAPPPQGTWIPPHHQPTTHLHHQPLPPSPMPPQHHQPQSHHQQPPTPSHVAPHHPPSQVAHLPPATQPQPQPLQHLHPHPQQPQLQQSFSRSAAVVPTQVDARHANEAEDLGPMPSLRDGLMHEVVKNCSTLYSFAKNHVQLQTAISHAQPSPADLTDMSHLAIQVVRMLEEWKHNNCAEVNSIKLDNPNGFTTIDDSRAPKRPWEDMSRNGAQDDPDTNEDESTADKTQTTAEQDMELIRTKRASSTAGGSGVAGQPKSKYRKRSRATPPGKCHSCNIRETPEWRRGPDGARTLCNACGLHYAKLMRKKEKSGSGNSEQISLEDLRASARSGDMEKNRSKAPRTQQSSDSPSHEDGNKQVNQQQQAHQPPSQQQHHQGSFQVMSLGPESSGSDTTNHMQATASQQTMSIPSHSWPAPASSSSAPTNIPHPSHVNASAARYAPDQFQHQSFMRSSQPVVIPQASPR
ncbi:hypothetical protein JOM56_001270 [Amanita muscaria]